MTHAFPYAFEPEDSGGVLVQFVDVPEAHTSGANGAAAGEQALDCLIAALGGYLKLARPRSPARGRSVAILPPLVAAKLALYEAMSAQDITRTELARRLGLHENAVRRLLDLDHRSHIIGSGEERLNVERSLEEGDADPLGALLTRERVDLVAAAISRLPERERMVITLYYHEELTMKEVGAVLGLTESRVSQLHSQAMLRLKAPLADHFGGAKKEET